MSRHLLVLVVAGVLSACSAVYKPLIAPTPAISKAGQAETTAHVNFAESFEGSVAYSPVGHVLLTAAGSMVGSRPSANDSIYFRQRQYDVGLGGYHTFHNGLNLGAIGGFGQGKAQRGFQETRSVLFIIPVADGISRYEARYNKYFLQAYLVDELFAKDGGARMYAGASLRHVWLDMQSITRNGVPAEHAANRYLEGSLFLRGGGQILQGQLTLGVSQPNQEEIVSGPSNATLTIGLGLVFHPQQIGWRRRLTASP